MTNTMHQLGGPVGLSLIILMTSQIKNIITYYHIVMWMITVYLIIGLVILLFTQKSKMKDTN